MYNKLTFLLLKGVGRNIMFIYSYPYSISNPLILNQLYAPASIPTTKPMFVLYIIYYPTKNLKKKKRKPITTALH